MCLNIHTQIEHKNIAEIVVTIENTIYSLDIYEVSLLQRKIIS